MRSGVTTGPPVSGTRNGTTAFDTHQAKRHAATQATTDSTRPSASRLRTIRPREAPRDCRTAISRWRTTARAISRLVTLAQTITMVRNVTAENTASMRLPRVATMLLPPAVAE